MMGNNNKTFVVLLVVAALSQTFGMNLGKSMWGQNAALMSKARAVLRCEKGEFVGMDQFMEIMTPKIVCSSEAFDQKAHDSSIVNGCMLHTLALLDNEGYPSVRRISEYISTIYSPQIIQDVRVLRPGLLRCVKEYRPDNYQLEIREPDLNGFLGCFETMSQKLQPMLKLKCHEHEEWQININEFMRYNARYYPGRFNETEMEE